MPKITRSQLERSFEAYTRMVGEWEEKGYATEFVFTDINAYAREFAKAKEMGMKNIARTFAADTRIVTKENYYALKKTKKRVKKRVRDKSGNVVRNEEGQIEVYDDEYEDISALDLLEEDVGEDFNSWQDFVKFEDYEPKMVRYSLFGKEERVRMQSKREAFYGHLAEIGALDEYLEVMY